MSGSVSDQYHPMKPYMNSVGTRGGVLPGEVYFPRPRQIVNIGPDIDPWEGEVVTDAVEPRAVSLGSPEWSVWLGI